jgi:uncharacterized membrane protein
MLRPRWGAGAHRRGLVAGLTAVILVAAITPAASSLAAPVFTIALSSSLGPATSDLVIQVSGLPSYQGFDCMIYNPVSTPPPHYIGRTLGRGVASENGESRFVAAVPNLREQVYLVVCRYKTPGGDLVLSKIRLFEITTEYAVKSLRCGDCNPKSINTFGLLTANAPGSSNTAQAVICALALGKCMATSPAGSSAAYGINDSGQVVGYANGFRPAECTIATNCTWTNLCSSTPCPAAGTAINNSGLVVGGGYACRLSGSSCPWKSLGTLGSAPTVANALNSSGLIVGYSFLSTRPGNTLYHAFACTYKVGACSGGGLHDIGTLGGDNSYALGVNDSNVIVGQSNRKKGSTTADAFECAYDPLKRACKGPMIDLKSLGGSFSAAYAINHDDEIVGSSYVTGNTDYHAAEWTGGSVYDLNKQVPASSGWDLQSASAINNLEQIVGTGVYKGTPAGFYLNPVSPAGPIVSQVAISDTRLSPASTEVIQGGSVQWLNGGSHKFSIADATGMKLFASKPLATMRGFVRAFSAAGTYPYAGTTSGSTRKGSISVPVETAPATGAIATTFQVYWADAAAPKGFRYEIQIRRPGKHGFANWLTGQTATESSFVPKSRGVYSFRARLFDMSNGKTSGWSLGAAITVS